MIGTNIAALRKRNNLAGQLSRLSVALTSYRSLKEIGMNEAGMAGGRDENA